MPNSGVFGESWNSLYGKTEGLKSNTFEKRDESKTRRYSLGRSYVETKFDHPYFATINSDLNLIKEDFKETEKSENYLPPIKSPRANYQII